MPKPVFKIDLVPNQKPHLSCNPDWAERIDDPKTRVIELNALEYKSVPLSILVGASSRKNKPRNKLATKIVRYLREETVIRTKYCIHGTAILYVENGDMTQQIWDLIQQEIKAKRKKVMSKEWIQYVMQREQIEFGPKSTQKLNNVFIPYMNLYGMKT